MTHAPLNLCEIYSDRTDVIPCSPPARSDRYDAGQNEAMVARLARPTRVMGEDGQFVGIQIVYG